VPRARPKFLNRYVRKENVFLWLSRKLCAAVVLVLVLP